MNSKSIRFDNPFKPGAGHMPPYLAGRNDEEQALKRLLVQRTILENLILTGLRGVGKTVLLEKFKDIAITEGWLWVGTDLSETASLTEENLCLRIITDLSVITSNIEIGQTENIPVGFTTLPEQHRYTLNFHVLQHKYSSTPGLCTDKLKSVLEFVWSYLQKTDIKGVVFAYDEAQNLEDHRNKEQYPLSVLLESFQSIQRKNIPFLLILTGLPTLFPKLVEARTYAERMFHIIFLKALDNNAAKQAITIPIGNSSCPVKISQNSVDIIVKQSGGYPYFIQYICREVYDLLIQHIEKNQEPRIPVDEITRKLDSDFFSGRWARVTDRQRDLLKVIANMNNCDDEFSVIEISEKSKDMPMNHFKGSQINQMLSTLADAGLVYKNRHGKYSLAVPLLAQFIRRQIN